MLPPFIIEQIRQREQRERDKRERPALQLPLPPLADQHDEFGPASGRSDRDDTPERGVVIIAL